MADRLEELYSRMRVICVIGALFTIISINMAALAPYDAVAQLIPLGIMVLFGGVVVIGGGAVRAQIEYDSERS